MKKYYALLLLAVSSFALGQSYPFTQGQTLTAAGLNSAFAARATFSSGPLTAGYVLFGNGAGDIVTAASTGLNGQVLTSNGSSAPTWQAVGVGTAISALTITATGALPSSGTTGVFSYGTLGFTDSNMVETFAGSVNGYIQNVLQNKSNGTGASTDYVVNNNLGTATTYYGDFGINSSTFAGTGPFSAPSATYVTATSGDLALGTTTANAIHLCANSCSTDAATVSSSNVFGVYDGAFTISNSTDSTKQAVFSLSGFPTATTYTYTLPSSSGTLASLNTAQVFTTAQVFNSTITVTGTANLNGLANNIGVSTIGGVQNIGTGATLSGNTLTVNVGTAGVSGSTTAINLGGSNGSTTTIKGTLVAPATTVTTLGASSTITPSTTAGIVGTTLADNANTGSVGEYLSATSSAIGLTSGAAINTSSVTLTAGDWDVQCAMTYNPAGSTVVASVWASVSATTNTLNLLLAGAASIQITHSAGVGELISSPTSRWNVSVSTPLYCVALSSFSVSTATATGYISARRRR